jgi:hypothetical protein
LSPEALRLDRWRSLGSNGLAIATASSISPHQTRPSFGHFAPFVGCMAASASALLLFAPVAGDAPAFLRRSGLRQKAAIGAAENDGGTMRMLTLTELMRPSKIELCDLLARITTALPEFPEGSAERANALMSLGDIRRILACRDFSP